MKPIFSVFLAVLLLLSGCSRRVPGAGTSAPPTVTAGFWEQSAPDPSAVYTRLRAAGEPLTGSDSLHSAYIYYDTEFLAQLWAAAGMADWAEADSGHDHDRTVTLGDTLSLTFYNGPAYSAEEDNLTRYDEVRLYADGCAARKVVGDPSDPADDRLLCYAPGTALYNRLLQRLLDYGTAGVETVRPADFVRGINASSGVRLPGGDTLPFGFFSGDESGRRHALLVALGLDLSKDWDAGAMTWRFIAAQEGLPDRDPDLFFTPNRFGVYAEEDLAVIYDPLGQTNWYALPPGTGEALLALLERWAAP